MGRRVMPAVLAAVALACGGSTGTAPSALVRKIDSIVSVPIEAGTVAGASIAVVKGSDTIAVQGFGKASLELDVPTPLHAVYEIGSVTKQFTAAAVMQLVERGKIDLDRDITTYLPDYDTQGRRIPVRMLLNHTSGIKGYTEMPEFRGIRMEHLSRDTLVELFSRKPFDFEPGEEEIYNNSAYFLLGLIIEKVSGLSYADYVQANLFDRAGMKDAHYCSERRIYPGDVEGYDTDSTGLVQKAYLDQTWPYAAGSLCASAVDLVAWNQALHGGRILGAEAYKEYIAPGRLNDGTPLHYAMGLAINDVVGHRAFHHGGGINGFLSENIYFPDDSLSVVVLFNTAGPASPEATARDIAEAVLGEPADGGKPFEGDLSEYVGTYAGHGRGRPLEMTITAGAGALAVRIPLRDDSARALTYLGADRFSREGTIFNFVRKNGRITGLDVDAAYGYNRLARKRAGVSP